MSTRSLELAQTLAVTLTAAQTGLICNSVLVVSAFSHSPTIETAKIWRRVYIRGKPLNLGIALVSGSLWSYLAYHTLDSRASKLYTFCAACVPALIAFALVVQKPLDDSILETAIADKADATHIKRLFDKWYALTAVRAAIMGSAAITGAWAIVSKPRAL
ncbi:hypothetical protein NliqN6_4783 [Naganishia liquefaciens]|uniref:Uncharacterized protein n=1 Tax=Naganishia liquefaciens TaxID=104408 RepID=A0A8H3TVL6_9TREE|nr:hypothetical protein NliqN6_4783 [Naganishia liquefaciens]